MGEATHRFIITTNTKERVPLLDRFQNSSRNTFTLLQFQGCGGSLNGTVPSSGTLHWVINAADLMIVSLTFSDWTVG
jgi:hypothetical protein